MQRNGLRSLKYLNTGLKTKNLSTIALVRAFQVAAALPHHFPPQFEVFAQVYLTHLFIGGQFFRGALLQDLAFKEQVGPVCYAKGFLHVVIGDQYAYVLVLQPGHNALYVFHGNGVHTSKGFIQQNESWFRGQRAGYFRTAPFAPAQHIAPVLAHMLQAEFVQQSLQPFLLVFFGLSGHLQNGADVILHTQLPKNAGLLRQIADPFLRPFVHGQIGDVLIIQEDVAAVGLYKPHDHVEGGGLAGAIGTQQAHDLALLHLHMNAIHHRAALVFLEDVLCPQHLEGDVHLET